MWAISLLMRFSSSSLTLHARKSAMYCCSGPERNKSDGQSLRAVHLRGEAETHRETTHIIFDHLDREPDALATLSVLLAYRGLSSGASTRRRP